MPHHYGKVTRHMGAHSVTVTCHLAEARILPLPPSQSRYPIPDLATPEGCKAELTYVS